MSEVAERQNAGRSPAVVALGGGHGLAASLSALRLMTSRLTAVVTVADDGGSSGRLREELDILPPGDLRMALSALCDDSEWGRTWRDVLQHRFSTEGPLDRHAVGNLLIAALWELLGDPVAGLDWVGRLLGARGRVLPMSCTPLAIEADIEVDGRLRTVVGQSRVAVTPGRVAEVRLTPAGAAACEEAVQAVDEADWVVLGPGSWFTSVLPHVLVPELSAALHRTAARRCVTLNLRPDEPTAMTNLEHLRALAEHAPDLRVDVVVADPGAVIHLDELAAQAESMGARLMLRQVGVGDGTARHDGLRLAGAYRDAFEGFWGDLGTGRGMAG
ncbi:uridine diphosphate-N-acetylglucosamine-binding protein YvcK [Isoptericola sp. b441]|uniref:Putative gluconeogenesis factor n=1 Tax=Actinotalea lenta TaxID=3064654 RepID=A0ABT9DE63_9CELL|nr:MULTISPECIES: uridine diphosphate-N-acetylglucosamine-binding protein YvcK [unclassified Isoptericola]MDO8107668.1 uridine diphosphate-N-acetylglucosamine-binding protein YvcK [Isoptericola sp. b441]MDO8120672.1 uridine diphosphate-N-acetylglucosamine-binding protein YvcK [Isoptericola sp. b490]